MDLIIEIGTSSEQALIRNELEALLGPLQEAWPENPIRRIVLARDFEGTVNALARSERYRSRRPVGDSEISAMAKILHQADPPTVVLSPGLYTDPFDAQVRLFILVHEFIHARNRERFPCSPSEPLAKAAYFQIWKTFLDEYFADRSSYEVTDVAFKRPSPYWQRHVQSKVNGFLDILRDRSNVSVISAAVSSFRFHGDVDRFLDEIYATTDGIFLSMVHLVALFDHHQELADWSNLEATPFLQSRDEPLFDLARTEYELRQYDFEAGVTITAQFMERFGFRLEDRPAGPYCHVLDIKAG